MSNHNVLLIYQSGLIPLTHFICHAIRGKCESDLDKLSANDVFLPYILCKHCSALFVCGRRQMQMHKSWDAKEYLVG